MLASSTAWWSTVVVTISVAVTFSAFALCTRKGLLPKLPPVEAGLPPGPSERRRYYAGNSLSVALGLLAGILLFAQPINKDPSALFSHSYAEGSDGRLIGSFFLFLGTTSFLTGLFARWFVPASALLHILHQTARRFGGADPIWLTRWLGLALCSAALFLHFGFAAEHTTFREHGVYWRDMPWHEEQHRPWSDVVEVRLVQQAQALVGTWRDRPHLMLVFADGTKLRIGSRSGIRADAFEAPAALASARSGATVVRMERVPR